MTYPLETQGAAEIYQGAALLVVNKDSNSSPCRCRPQQKINMNFKAAIEAKKMKYNGKSIIISCG